MFTDIKMNLDALEPQIDAATNILRMLSNPVRLKLMCLMSESELSVLDLADHLKLSQPAVSHHLKLLRAAGIVQSRRDAQTIYNRVEGREVMAIMQTLSELYCPE
jgi:DNA-binding transcriptional ArsR family regulator